MLRASPLINKPDNITTFSQIHLWFDVELSCVMSPFIGFSYYVYSYFYGFC